MCVAWPCSGTAKSELKRSTHSALSATCLGSITEKVTAAHYDVCVCSWIGYDTLSVLRKLQLAFQHNGVHLTITGLWLYPSMHVHMRDTGLGCHN